MIATSLTSENLDEQKLEERNALVANPMAKNATLTNNEFVSEIEKAIGQPCVLVNPADGTLERVSKEWLSIDLFRWLPLCEQVSRKGRPEVIEEHSPLMLLAIPLEETDDASERIAVSLLVTGRVDSVADVTSAARVFDIEPEKLFAWASSQPSWPPAAAIRLVEALFENKHLKQERHHNNHRLTDVSDRLIATFEELNLLHRLTEQLSVDRSVRDLCNEVVNWLAEVIPSNCLVARWFTQEDILKPGSSKADEGRTFATGDLPFGLEEVDQFYDRLGTEATTRALVLDHKVTSSPTWCYPTINEVVCVPILTDDQQVGWIAAINHGPKHASRKGQLGTIQSSLLTSVCSILGVHAGNRILYHKKQNLLDSAVRAITSAIDAKDSYTCGHSDRVARIAVRLAKQLGFSDSEQKAIYLGGLLHDVGKIGINDDVLSKPGQLTAEEYDHIKKHPEFGAKIVDEVEELRHVLPIVLHHHEAWDGSGYPHGLREENCPSQARVMAVADAFDAMGSDRPYRKGMPFDRIESIFREGAGKQWDPKVIKAYFTVREDVHAIAKDGLIEEIIESMPMNAVNCDTA